MQQKTKQSKKKENKWKTEEDFISTVQVSLKMSVRVTAVEYVKAYA